MRIVSLHFQIEFDVGSDKIPMKSSKLPQHYEQEQQRKQQVPQQQHQQQQHQRQQEIVFENAMLKSEIKRLASENQKLKR